MAPKHTSITEVYKEITTLAAEITKISKEHDIADEDFCVEQSIDKCISETHIDPYFARLMCQINHLAALWDTVLYNNRKAQDKLSSIIPHHRFVVVTDHDNCSTQSSMYNKRMLPDKRIVVINSGKMRSNMWQCVLHEMGHYIGYRRRTKRLYDYFIPLVADAFCTRIYFYSCNLYNGVDINSPDRDYIDDDAFAPWVKAFAERMQMITQSMYPSILDRILNDFTSIVKAYEDDNREKTGNARNEQIDCIRAGFFDSVDSLITYSIKNSLLSHEVIQAYTATVETICHSLDNGEHVSAEMKKTIRKAFNQIRCDFSREINGTYIPQKPWWYLECEEKLEEPAADIFMIKMAKMTRRQYVNTIVQQALFLPSSKDITSLSSLINHDAFHSRIISVCVAMNMRRRHFFSIKDLWARLLPLSSQGRKEYAVRELLYRVYTYAQAALDSPVDTVMFSKVSQKVFTYVKELYSDKRYAQFQNSNRAFLRSFRKNLSC